MLYVSLDTSTRRSRKPFFNRKFAINSAACSWSCGLRLNAMVTNGATPRPIISRSSDCGDDVAAVYGLEFTF